MSRPTKRKTKHRGNAAGMIEAKGVTSARSSATATKKVDPRMLPPTWRSAFNRALIAAAIFALAMMIIIRGNIVSTMFVAILLVGVYTPFGFYFDRWIYNRRIAKLEAARIARNTTRKPSR